MSIANEIQRLQSAKADIKSAIENKGVIVGDGTIDTYAERISEISGGGGSGDYEQGYEDGKNSVMPFERYLVSAQFSSLNIFETEKAEITLDSATSLGALFRVEDDESINTTVTELTINCPNQIISMQNSFNCNSFVRFDRTLKKLVLNVDTSKCAGWYYAFSGLYALETIEGQPLNFGAVTSNFHLTGTFNQTVALSSFAVVPNTIKINFSVANSRYLSTDTIQSIIDGLADLTGGTAQTLTLHSTVGAKLTDEQKATITAKNWTLVY